MNAAERYRARPVTRRVLLALLGAGLLCSGAAHAAAGAAPFLWEVEGAKARHYLVGSVHVLPQDQDTLPDAIVEVYTAATDLVFETDIAALEQPQVQLDLLARARSQQPLKQSVGASLYAKLQKRAAELGMPGTMCDPFKAWFCALSLEVFAYQKAGFSADAGIDKRLYEAAQADGKRVGWFEAPEAHLALFTNMSEALGREFLVSALEEDGSDEPAVLYKAWRDNDVAAVEKLVALLKREQPQVYERILAGRNRAWMPKLSQLLSGGRSQLIVAGAAHWVGPDGLVAQLKARGYKIKPYLAFDTQMVTQAPDAPWPQSVSLRR